MSFFVMAGFKALFFIEICNFWELCSLFCSEKIILCSSGISSLS